MQYTIDIMEKYRDYRVLKRERVEASGPGDAFKQVSRKYVTRRLSGRRVVLSKAFEGLGRGYRKGGTAS